MAEPWKVAQATKQRLDLERGLERMELQCPRNPAARALFMQIRPGESIAEDTIHFLLTVDQPK
jgi:hypothetical protein